MAHAVRIGVHMECRAPGVRAGCRRGEPARAAHAGGNWPTSTDARRERAAASEPPERSGAAGSPRATLRSGGALAPLARATTRAGGAIEGALRVADLQGQLSWMPIDLSSGRFPFDVVRSIAVVGNALYVGTDAGLQAYDGTDFALEHARLITLAADASAAPPTIERVGESCDAPGTAVVCGPRGCARQAGSAFVDAPANALSCRLRARSPFWSWQVDASGPVRPLRGHAGSGHAGQRVRPERSRRAAGDARERAAPARRRRPGRVVRRKHLHRVAGPLRGRPSHGPRARRCAQPCVCLAGPAR